MKKLFLLSFLIFFNACEFPILDHEDLNVQTSGNDEQEMIFLSHIDRLLALKWKSDPYGDPSYESIFELSIFDQNGAAADLPQGYEIYHYGWMPDMGHGTADDGLLIQKDIGIWESHEFRFNMPGRWQLVFEIYREGTKIEEAIFDFIF